MKKAKALIPLLIIGLIASGTAFTMDDVLDLSCAVPMAAAYNPVCTPLLADDIAGNSGDVVQDEIYKAALFVEDNKEQVLTEKKSRLNQTFGMAMSDAKLTVINSLNNGESVATAKANATDDVENYYSLLQQSIISYRNRNIMKLNESIGKIEGTSGVTCSDVFKAQQTTGIHSGSSFSGVSCSEINITEANGTLYNGTEVDNFNLKVHVEKEDMGGSSTSHKWVDFTEQKTYDTSGDSTDSSFIADTVLKASDSYGNTTKMFDGPAYIETTDQLYNRHTQAYDNVRQMTEGVFNNYQAGSINVSDALGPLEELQTASTSYADTGYYSYLATSFEQMGLAYNESYAFKLEWKNPDMSSSKTAVGQLFVPESSWNTTFKKGETYDATSKTAWFVHASDGGSAVSTELKGNFTILEMTDKETGEEVNQTTVQVTEFRTSDTSDLQEQLEELKERQDELLKQTNAGGGVVDGLNSFFNGLASALGFAPEVIMAAAVLILLLFVVVATW